MIALLQPISRELARPKRARPPRPGAVPKVSGWMLEWFTRYTRRYLRRHFHAVRLASDGPPALPTDRPLVVFTNHPAWWDPLVCLFLTRTLFPGRHAFAPIDATALRRYRFFARLGFFGVETGTARGAAQFLGTARAILNEPGTVLWLTPQGRFADVRERPVKFLGGLGHLPALLPRALFLPLALEYPFWEERTPEALARFGEPLRVGEQHSDWTPGEWTRHFESALTQTQDQLSTQALERRPETFRTLLGGASGGGGVYDLWRWLRARARGESFQPGHGE